MHILHFIISIAFCLVTAKGFSQKQSKQKQTKDSITYKTGYGLRLGADISKLASPILDKSYSGLEIVMDYRISKSWYIASELGYESDITYEDYTQSSAKGNYIRLGANYNAYDNWLDMNNEIYVGLRYGFATFEHKLHSYTPNVSTTYFPTQTINTPTLESGLNAHWAELQFGIKAEVYKNLFIGLSGAFKISINIDDQTNFKTLYAPGFNKVRGNRTGLGFNYTISYLIPFVKK